MKVILCIVIGCISVNFSACKRAYIDKFPHESKLLGCWKNGDKMKVFLGLERECELINVTAISDEGISYEVNTKSKYKLHENGPHGGAFIEIDAISEYFYIKKNRKNEIVLELRLSSDPLQYIDFKK